MLLLMMGCHTDLFMVCMKNIYLKQLQSFYGHDYF